MAELVRKQLNWQSQHGSTPRGDAEAPSEQSQTLPLGFGVAARWLGWGHRRCLAKLQASPGVQPSRVVVLCAQPRFVGESRAALGAQAWHRG